MTLNEHDRLGLARNALPSNLPQSIHRREAAARRKASNASNTSSASTSTPQTRHSVKCLPKMNPINFEPSRNVAAQTQRKSLFRYPALPAAETALCWTVMLSALCYGWYCVYAVSQRWALFRLGSAVAPYHRHHVPFVGEVERFKDNLNWEWSRWHPFALSFVPFLLGHFVLFNVMRRLCGGSFEYGKSGTRLVTLGTVLNTAYSMAVCVHVFGPKLVGFSLAQGTWIFACTMASRKTLTVWISSLPGLYLVMNHTDWLSADVFHVLLFVSYTMLAYISYCLDWTRGAIDELERERVMENAADNNNTPRTALARFRRMLFYTFYPPYMISLIVTYVDFERQLRAADAARWTRSRLATLTWRAVRVAVWWTLAETALHFLYFESVLHDEVFVWTVPKNELVTLGMAMGAFFHLKYAVIFGIPSLFAAADGMRPPGGAICISRVALYSKIWRGFDRGLYTFFKTYIFVPICEPTFSTWRRIVGVLVSYGFVLLWHGFHHQNIVWIALNIVELLVEYGAKGVYARPGVDAWRRARFSDTAFRRLLAVAQIVPFAFGLYSNFYFLGGSRVGWLFVQRIFIEETVPVRWPFLLLITVGYFYMHVAMDVERWLDAAGSGQQCPLAATKTQRQECSRNAKSSRKSK